MTSSEHENTQYLYLVLTDGGAPSIDFNKVTQELDIKKGATTKRWSRIKIAMASGKNPGGSAYQFLWLCLKHSTRDKAYDWESIAKACNTTAGAASKKYSRLKIAFEKGEAAPSPVKIKSDPNKSSISRKRKRAPTSNKFDEDSDDSEEGGSRMKSKAKRTKVTDTKTATKSKFKATKEFKISEEEYGSKAVSDDSPEAKNNLELMGELMDAVKAAGVDITGILEEGPEAKDEENEELEQNMTADDPSQDDQFFDADDGGIIEVA
ncbi:hypothetical protein B0J11DRAFT_571812 [Dendryphion nanum]|uniref:Myb-like DNA-binding domain-containing protein n=1 Tax=Dendryphion nanum TaxID=256645 RepID=A0A9P9IC42_9PLEO|nr:hypothetical protein B0J11DRAFT_571812 [Dendryphion nanum]